MSKLNVSEYGGGVEMFNMFQKLLEMQRCMWYG